MCLALRLQSRNIVIVGFESGHVARFELSESSEKDNIEHTCSSKILSKPILSLQIDSKGFGICCGASSSIVFFTMTKDSCTVRSTITIPGKPGFSDVALRNDNKIVALAGWDTCVRIFQWRRRRLPSSLRSVASSITNFLPRIQLSTPQHDATHANPLSRSSPQRV